MKEFKRGIMSIIWSLILACAAPVFIYFIASIFTDKTIIMYGLAAAAFIFLIIQTIFNENIKIEILDYNFKFYKRNELKHDLDLRNYYSGYSARTSDGTADYLRLQLIEKNTGEEILLDCTSLGQSKFYEMYSMVENFSDEKPTKKLETKKKEK